MPRKGATLSEARAGEASTVKKAVLVECNEGMTTGGACSFKFCRCIVAAHGSGMLMMKGAFKDAMGDGGGR